MPTNTRMESCVADERGSLGFWSPNLQHRKSASKVQIIDVFSLQVVTGYIRDPQGRLLLESLSLEQQLQSGQSPKWDGLTAMPLGQLVLQLVATTTEAKQVLLPRRGALPLLHQALEWQGLGVAQQPEACQEPAAWLKRARDRQLAMPISVDLLGPGWLKANGLVPLAAQPPLIEQLWLLLPSSAAHSKAARLCLRLLRVRINRAATATTPVTAGVGA
ncbi:MAG: hypothetical protein ACOYLI_04295 [Synechococcus lacustris]